MKQDPKILLFCPVSNYKDYIIWDWIRHIKKLTYQNLDILLIDNSDNKLFAQRIAAEGIDCINAHKQGENIASKMLVCYKIFHHWFLENKYDYWFSLECDVFPPLNIIEWLLCYRLPAVGIPYFTFANGADSLLFTDLSDTFKNEAGAPREHRATYFQAFNAFNGLLSKQQNAGIGCLLIHKAVLRKIRFHGSERGLFPDSVLYEDMEFAGYDVYLDTSTLAIHFNSNWKTINKIDDEKRRQSFNARA